MSIITVEKLGKYYGAQDVFADLSFSIAHGDKIGLVGPNGVGKTTLLRILLGLEEPSMGSVQRARNLRIGYLPQNPSFPSDRTLYAEMLEVYASLRVQQDALLALAEELSRADDPSVLMDRYAQAEQRFDLAGGYEYENRIHRVLNGLGFGPALYDWPITLLSGGQVTRALLARLLLQEPDLLVLDEPTNYLDLQALEWFEAYLQEWPQSLLVVSHDRYFLDHVVSRVWELNHGSLETYRGNYGSYVVQKRERLERRVREYEEQQEQIAETEDFVRRYKAGQRSKEARGRQIRLERLERLELPTTDPKMHLRMTTTLRSGDNVLMSEGTLIGFGSSPAVEIARPRDTGDAGDPGADLLVDAAMAGDEAEQQDLFFSGEFLVQRGQRVALLGPNGSGKTTFLRTVLGQVEPLAGQVRVGASVRIGYLPQRQDWLDPELSVLEQLMEGASAGAGARGDLDIASARHLLARFLFRGDDVFKLVGNLSGGERSRLALAILTIRGANLLLLDEPTTHLDIDSQEILQDVLAHFEGTILLVSHDRYLVDALATHVWAIEKDHMRQLKGNYATYLQTLEQERLARLNIGKSVASQEYEDRRRQDREKQRAERRRTNQLESLESEITSLEQQLRSVTHLLELASHQQDVARIHALSQEYHGLEQRLAARMTEWERAITVAGEAS